MRITIEKVAISEVEQLALLANEIWSEHYGSIFGVLQTQTLIENLQNKDAILKEMASGYIYCFVKLKNHIVGYFDYIENKDELYCGKIYLLKNFRGLGLGKEVFSKIEQTAILLGKKEFRLSANSSSESTIKFCTTQGMKIDKTEINTFCDIESVDFIMSKEICPVEKALKYFFQGYNCSQSVVMGFAAFFDIKPEHIISLGLAFGGGFARTRNICGAMSGIGLVVSHVKGTTAPDAKDEIYEIVRNLSEKFEERNSSILCGDILQNIEGITTTPKSDERTEEYYSKRPCAKVIENASDILLEYLKSEMVL